ncbi:hypothetical protein EYF80_050408 [Liparis tanakae]|uniref:Uncharacterized protein n=1 Tax=Liparis tanakae TaxID=230148 RepID=A0A4Z2FE66_9TELE|nr:hypothetical protein EYF80_050408 [Liparis tanakae]
MGSMLRGKRRMLKSASDTKAFWASSTFFSSLRTYTAKVNRATCRATRGRGEGRSSQREERPFQMILMTRSSLSRIFDTLSLKASSQAYSFSTLMPFSISFISLMRLSLLFIWATCSTNNTKEPGCFFSPYLPEEVEGQHHLQRGGPDHVDVGDEVHEALSVHRHQVDHLSHRGDGSYDGGAQTHARDKADVEVLLEDERLHTGADEEQRRVEVAVPVGGAGVVDEADQQPGAKSSDGSLVFWALTIKISASSAARPSGPSPGGAFLGEYNVFCSVLTGEKFLTRNTKH